MPRPQRVLAPSSCERIENIQDVGINRRGFCRFNLSVPETNHAFASNEGSKSDALRLAAANAILDRGVGKAAQSVAPDLNLTKKLDELSDDELIALRDRYAALATGAPKLIEHLAEQENASEPYDDGDDDDG